MRYILFSILLLLPISAAAQNEASSGSTNPLLQRLNDLEQRLSKMEGAPAKTSISAFNPSMGLALDFAYTHGPNDRSNFNFRAAEVGIEAPVDPFLKGWGVITGSQGGVDVEEAALQTTSLPYNLTVTGGRLFASFGRLAHFHDHELPVTDRPKSLDTFIGGETQADGVEVSYLFPTNTYINATAGMYNKLGADNTRADNAVARSLENFTYLGRLNSYLDLGDDHSVELGVDSAWTPKRWVTDSTGLVNTRRNTWRTLNGVDLTYRYHPSQGGMYRGAVWGTEVMQNTEMRFNTLPDPANGNAPFNLPTDRVRAYSGLSYVQFKVGPRLHPGVLIDLTEDLDQARKITRTYSGFLSCDVSEFQRVRVVYSHQMDNVPGTKGADIVALQWTGIMGHHVHGFRDR